MGRRQSNTSTYHFRRRGLKASRNGQAHKISAHDHWFWIDLADQKSKALSEAFYSLFYSQLGATKPGDLILTLPMSTPPSVTGVRQKPARMRQART